MADDKENMKEAIDSVVSSKLNRIPELKVVDGVIQIDVEDEQQLKWFEEFQKI